MKQGSPFNRNNKSFGDDEDMQISERRSTLLNKTSRSQKEELLSKRSGSNERNIVSQPYLDVKKLFEEKEKDFNSSMTFAAKKKNSNEDSHNQEMANTIREKLADGEDTLSLNRSISKFLIETVPKRNK